MSSSLAAWNTERFGISHRFTLRVRAARQQHDGTILRMTAAGLHRLVDTAAAAYHTERPAVDRPLGGQELQRRVDIPWHPVDHALASGGEVRERSRTAATKSRGNRTPARCIRQCSASSQAGRRYGDRRCIVQQQNGGPPFSAAWKVPSSVNPSAVKRTSRFTSRLDGCEEKQDCQDEWCLHRSISTSLTSASRSTRKPMFGVPIPPSSGRRAYTHLLGSGCICSLSSCRMNWTRILRLAESSPTCGR